MENAATIVWYRLTEEEARVLADSDDSYVFLGYGYNKSFPTHWAVQVYNRTVAQLVRAPL